MIVVFHIRDIAFAQCCVVLLCALSLLHDPAGCRMQTTILLIATCLATVGQGVGISREVQPLVAQPNGTGAALGPVVSSRVARTVASRLGLGAELLAAAGFDEAEASLIASRLRQHLDTHATTILALDAMCRARAASLRTLESDRPALTGQEPQIARDQLTAARNQRDAALAAALEQAITGQSAEKCQRLRNCIAARRWNVPVEYTTRVRTDAQWRALAARLSRSRALTAFVSAGPLPTAAQATPIAEPESIEARTRIQTRATAIRQAMSAVLGR